MSERLCGSCWYFVSARSCYDKPIWGHCTWPIQHGHEEEAGPNGQFTWADNTCEDYRARQEAITRG